jgi:hypothetical protein
MDIDEFADTYQLPIDVLTTLKDLKFREPQYLLSFSINDFIAPKKTLRGFGLVLGDAAELYAKLTMWSTGRDVNDDPIELEDELEIA